MVISTTITREQQPRLYKKITLYDKRKDNDMLLATLKESFINYITIKQIIKIVKDRAEYKIIIEMEI